MNKYSFSQLMLQILPKLKGLRVRQYVEHTPSEHNESDSENLSTTGDATLLNFFVASPRRILSEYAVVGAPRNSIQGRNLQLRKENI